MGLSSSQARLLSITSRLSDLELKAQSISNSKIRLASASQDVSKKYTDALDSKVLTVLDSQNNRSVNANAMNLTTYDPTTSIDTDSKGNQRFISDSIGRVLVSNQIKNAYETSGGSLEEFLNNVGPQGYSTFSSLDAKIDAESSPLINQLGLELTNVAKTGAIDSITKSTYDSVDATTSTDLTAASTLLADAKANWTVAGNTSITDLYNLLKTGFGDDASSEDPFDATQLALISGQADAAKAANDLVAQKSSNMHANVVSFSTSYADSSVFTKLAQAAPSTYPGNPNDPKVVCFYASAVGGNSSDLSAVRSALASQVTSTATATTTALLALLQTSFGSGWTAASSDINAAAAKAKQDTIDFYTAKCNNYKHYDVQDADNAVTTSLVAGTNEVWNDSYGKDEFYIDLTQVVKTFLAFFDAACADISGEGGIDGKNADGTNVDSKYANENNGSVNHQWIEAQITVRTGQYSSSSHTEAYAFNPASIVTVTGPYGSSQTFLTQAGPYGGTVATSTPAQVKSINSSASQRAAQGGTGTSTTLSQTDANGNGIDDAYEVRVNTALAAIDLTKLTAGDPLKTTKSNSFINDGSSRSDTELASKLQIIIDSINSLGNKYTGVDTSVVSSLTSFVNELNAAGNMSSVKLDQLLTLLKTISPSNMQTSITDIKGENYNFDRAGASYYTNVFYEMDEKGYFTDGTNDDSNLSNSDWLYTGIKNGALFITEYDETEGDFMAKSYALDPNFVEVTDDTKVAKAEAEYNSSMAAIKTKDQRYDLDMKGIDTEHSALQNEADSVKKVIDKNIERSFKIFA